MADKRFFIFTIKYKKFRYIYINHVKLFKISTAKTECRY